MKALNGFLVIQRQMTLKTLSKSFIGHLYGDGLLADGVDMQHTIISRKPKKHCKILHCETSKSKKAFSFGGGGFVPQTL